MDKINIKNARVLLADEKVAMVTDAKDALIYIDLQEYAGPRDMARTDIGWQQLDKYKQFNVKDCIMKAVEMAADVYNLEQTYLLISAIQLAKLAADGVEVLLVQKQNLKTANVPIGKQMAAAMGFGAIEKAFPLVKMEIERLVQAENELASAAGKAAKEVQKFTDEMHDLFGGLKVCARIKSVEPHRPSRKKRKRRANWQHKIDKFDAFAAERGKCKIQFCKMYHFDGARWVKMKPLETGDLPEKFR